MCLSWVAACISPPVHSALWGKLFCCLLSCNCHTFQVYTMGSSKCLYLSSLASSVVILIFINIMYCSAKCFYSKNHGSCGVLHLFISALKFYILSKCRRDFHIYWKRANGFYSIVKFSISSQRHWQRCGRANKIGNVNGTSCHIFGSFTKLFGCALPKCWVEKRKKKKVWD